MTPYRPDIEQKMKLFYDTLSEKTSGITPGSKP